MIQAADIVKISPSKARMNQARIAAFITLEAILKNKSTLANALILGRRPLKYSRDKAFHRQLVMLVLRHFGELNVLIEKFIDRSPKGKALKVLTVLRIGMAQVLFLDVPPHAAVSTSVELTKLVGYSGHTGMVNAVLRRCISEGALTLVDLDGTSINTPAWLMESWCIAYGAEFAHAIASASLKEANLDLTVKSDIEKWATTLEGTILPTGSVRLYKSSRVETLPGFAEGMWWVQDAAATLPVRLFGNVMGKRVADICAAPGGKSAQLAVMGASVVSVDKSIHRMELLKENMNRLNLFTETIIADASQWHPNERFDAIILDAPCTATGTIRRHPDIGLAKSATDVTTMANLQSRILDNTVNYLNPGGILLYCTCSLQPEEGPEQVERFLERHKNMKLSKVVANEVFNLSEIITTEGYMRTLPNQLEEHGGWDGFFTARLIAT